MPFKRFPGDQGEAQSFPVSFGPPAATASNGNISNYSKKAVDVGSDQTNVLLPLHSSTYNSRQDARNTLASWTSGAALASSPPFMTGTSSSPPLSSKLRAHEQSVQREPTILPTRLPITSMGRFPQKPYPAINNSDLNEFPSKSKPQEETSWKSKSAREFPETTPYRVPNTQTPDSTTGALELKARNSPFNNTPSRSFGSALQNFMPTEDGSAVSLFAEQQRDEILKGRRFLRFNDPAAKGTFTGSNFETKGAVDPVSNRQAKGFSKHGSIMTRDELQASLTESEAQDNLIERDWQLTEPILGDCPDMCPESERLERERKGDLDKLERLNGDRNQTSRDLAVKKYTRTAEKQASLIRPISVLLKTMEHLLNLLNREYDEELLNLHNFLWDRMRAIRMDLRMQHIFNEQAVVMHEKMIRFHILAMHELCEYAKGEGFNEGFDAHLNIEQMNKASVDLFHMYDDLRKSGHICASEAEFRGYYALLKLDKHPGYVVEPAELSLDLAKMIPEMRTASEVHFARKVARACRSGNYLAFFRLARDATYLQACLMHAHFSKLRSQAMASLYSSLQRNQGIPIAQVEDWLGMEGEDIEVLLEYHGFVLRNYEELYMVKEGPFLNQHHAFHIRHSKLVEAKRSGLVKDDVLSSGQEKVSTVPFLERLSSLRRQSELQPAIELTQTDEEMPDYEEQQLQETPLDHPFVSSWTQRDETLTYENYEIQVPIPPFLASEVFVQKNMEGSPVDRKSKNDEKDNKLEFAKRRKFFSPSVDPSIFDFMPPEHTTTTRDEKLGTALTSFANASPQVTISAEKETGFVNGDHLGEEKTLKLESSNVEMDLAKARLMLRKWRARAALKAEERQERQQKCVAALSLLHVGLPMQNVEKDSFKRSLPSHELVEVDMVEAEDVRLEKIKNMWARLDVISIVAPVLRQNNPESKFLCWKLLVCTQVHDSDSRDGGRRDSSGNWLHAKVINQTPDRELAKEGTMLAHSSHAAKIFHLWKHHETRTPIFYIATDLHFRQGKLQDMEGAKGASGILFLISEGVPIQDEARRLNELVSSLSDNAQLPLLVVFSALSSSGNFGTFVPQRGIDIHVLAKILGMDKLDKQKIVSWTVLPIVDSYQWALPVALAQSSELETEIVHGTNAKGYYDENLLKNGLTWLASRAPKQPSLRCVSIQNLVMEHLLPSLKLLSTMEPANVTPDMCVKAFNDALAKTARDVNISASDSHVDWPPDELIQASEELRITSIPARGWNDGSYLRSVIEGLSLCQLPHFPVMNVGAPNVGDNVSLRQQKAALEHMLHSYVKHICGSTHADSLTLQAVDAVTQNSCMFKWTALGRLLIPNWALIFQHLYHIRLSCVSSDPPAVVWVQTKGASSEEIEAIVSSGFTKYRGPTLDEMIELENQETAMKRCFNKFSSFTEHEHSCEQLAWPSSFSMVAGIEESRQASTEALQECLGVGEETPEITGAIIPPTEGELELERMVNEFNERVDLQVTKMADFETDGRLGPLVAGDLLTALDGSNQSEKHTDIPMPLILDMGGAGSPASASHLCGESNNPDSFARLLHHCENVQNSIDSILRDCFQLRESK